MRPHWVSIWALGCAATVGTEPPAACVPELPDPGRSRVKQVVCGDELQGNHAEKGDWLLQSVDLTVYLRTERFALSKAGRAGGTLIDIYGSAGAPDVEELVPLLPMADGELDWFTDVDFVPIEDERGAGLRIEGILPDGTPGEFTWWIDHADNRLQLDGATDFDAVPLANTALRGDILSYGTNLVGPGAIASNEGGWFRWTDMTYLQPATDAQLPELLPDRYIQPIVGQCSDGEVLYLRSESETILQRVEIENREGGFDFLGDDRATEIICLAGARASSGWQPLPLWEPSTPPDEEIQLGVGNLGELSIEVTDPSGNPIPATVWWNDSLYYFGLGEGTMGVGAGTGAGVAFGGPAWSAANLPEQTVGEDSSTRAILHRVLPDTVLLADFAVEAWPHRTTRSSASSRVGRAIAAGVEWVVTVGDDTVVPTDLSELETDEAWSSSGARATTDSGTVWSWPWSFNRKANLWGAPDTRGLGPHDTLALMGGGRGLRTIVDTAWVDSAGPPYSWPVVPDALYLESPDDLPAYVELLDQYTGLAVVGPLTWIDGVDRRSMPQVEAERALDLGHTIATTGPLVQLRMAGRVEDRPLASPRVAHISVQAPTWMPVDQAALIGPGGTRIAEWTLPDPIDGKRLDQLVELPAETSWVLAMAWSDRTNAPLQATEAWAITSAVFLSPP